MSIQVLKGPSLSTRTTLRLGGSAIAELVLRKKEDFEDLAELLNSLGGEPLVLGRGSNILARDGDLPLVILSPAFKAECKICTEDDSFAEIEVQSGLPLPHLLRFCAESGLGGLEGLSGIPGTVGGAIAMNAGSYGCEIGSVLESVTLFTPDKGLVRLAKSEFTARYRDFSFAGKDKSSYFVIVGARLQMCKDSPAQIKKAMDEFIARKAATQPLQVFSAGCAFCNPSQEVSAGKLLDKCGFKGRELGGMMFSSLHANFLVNKGDGTSSEAFELIDMAKEAVRAETGYELNLEIKVWPCL